MTRTGNDLWVYTLSDLRVYTLSDRSMALWTLGYPEAALADVQRVAKEARVIWPRRQLGLCASHYFESLHSLRKLRGSEGAIR